METNLRTSIWNNLSNIKFKALYTNALSQRAAIIGNCYSFFLAFTSAGSVATWAFWNQYSHIWAIIIGISQIMQIAKPYIPFLKNDKSFLEQSFEYEKLYLEYEKLWYEYEMNEDIDAKKVYFRLREKENTIEEIFKQIYCPRLNNLINKIQKETYSVLSLNFS